MGENEARLDCRAVDLIYLPGLLLPDWLPLSFLLGELRLGLADPGSSSFLLSHLDIQLDISQHQPDHVVEVVVEIVSPELGPETKLESGLYITWPQSNFRLIKLIKSLQLSADEFLNFEKVLVRNRGLQDTFDQLRGMINLSSDILEMGSSSLHYFPFPSHLLCQLLVAVLQNLQQILLNLLKLKLQSLLVGTNCDDTGAEARH